MKVCDICLGKNYENKPSSDRANGICDICKKPGVCNRYKGKQLIPLKTSGRTKASKKVRCH